MPALDGEQLWDRLDLARVVANPGPPNANSDAGTTGSKRKVLMIRSSHIPWPQVTSGNPFSSARAALRTRAIGAVSGSFATSRFIHVDTAVKEVDEAVAKEVGREDESSRESVRAAFEAVDEAAGGEAVADLTRFVAGYVRDEGERPDPTAVDGRAADIVREHDGSLPEDSHLRNA